MELMTSRAFLAQVEGLSPVAVMRLAKGPSGQHECRGTSLLGAAAHGGERRAARWG